MIASQVTNQQIEEHFEVTVVGDFYATNRLGQRFYLTDLRTKYVSAFNAKSKTKKYAESLKAKKSEYIEDFFVELDRTFPEHNVLIRETQPGLHLPEIGLEIYCMVSPFKFHRLSITSKIFSAEDMKKDFSHYNICNKPSNTDITISKVETHEIIEIIKLAIELHTNASQSN